MKQLVRAIVTSATYRQSSRVTPEHRQRDMENRLYARASRFRMPAMLLRDWALATSGLLDRRLGGAPVYPYQPDDVWEPLAITKERDFTYPQSRGTDLYRRSLYTFWRRTIDRQICSTPRIGRHAVCASRHEHAVTRPHNPQRSHLGRGGPHLGRPVPQATPVRRSTTFGRLPTGRLSHRE